MYSFINAHKYGERIKSIIFFLFIDIFLRIYLSIYYQKKHKLNEENNLLLVIDSCINLHVAFPFP